MIVSWNWLQDYLHLDMPPAEVALRLMMAGLNHESTKTVGDDVAIDLEVTSNRPDCLGHIGIAREIGVLWGREMNVQSPVPPQGSIPVTSLTKITIQSSQLCFRYIARVIRGVKIGPSPAWLVKRLATVGLPAINNVVDITNYVLLECGQPLHAFDLSRLRGPEIIVREAQRGEKFDAINHVTYELEPGMCVIADAHSPVALAGVMGGAHSEVSASTRDLLIESAEFAPLSIRATARKLILHSPSSYRFERGVDPAGIDWASRRCCELILNLAGGELAAGAIDVGRPVRQPQPIMLRFSQLKRILGIDVPREEVRRILTALGLTEQQADETSVVCVPPSWRRDLEREIDLVEEVARIHGYDKIPEDAAVPMAPSHRSDEDRVLQKVRGVLTAAGFDESLSASVVRDDVSAAFSPWTAAEPLHTNVALLKGADRLRRSLVPSLLETRRVNESLANPVIELFETAPIYLPREGQLPQEQSTLALTSGGDYYRVKGVVEALLAEINPGVKLQLTGTSQPLLHAERATKLHVNGERLGFLGEVAPATIKTLGLRGPTTIAEVSLDLLTRLARLIPQYVKQSEFPAIARDLNLIVEERVPWLDLATTVSRAVGHVLEDLKYLETYRDPKKDGAGKKRLLLSVTLRRADRTLTNEEADVIRQNVVDACQSAHGAVLLG